MKSFPLAFFRSSIRKRIYAGFLIICVLLVLLSLVSLWGIWRINTATTTFHLLNKQADLLIGIDQATTEIQREAVRFMNEGRVSVGLSAVAKMHDLDNRLMKARSLETIGEDLKSTLERARGHLEVYEETFENAMQEKLLNDSLILMELPRISGILEKRLAAIHDAFPEENYLVALFRARTHLFSYFAELDSTLARKAFEDLDSLDLALAVLVGDDAGTSEMTPFIAETRKLLAEYRERTARSVQATRAYLYLINVVMSGEVSEIIFKANQLRASGEVRKEELKARMRALIDRISLSIILISVLAVGGGFLYAVVIARQITLPLTRITATLLDLSRGRSVSAIPGSSNADEIGDLAKSANVFHEKNVQCQYPGPLQPDHAPNP